MSEAWCGQCFLGPMTVRELIEHRRARHAPSDEPFVRPQERERRPKAPKPARPPERVTGFKACSVCGAPLIEDEEGVCVFCE